MTPPARRIAGVPRGRPAEGLGPAYETAPDPDIPKYRTVARAGDLDGAIGSCSEKIDLLKSVPRVGDLTARILVAELPELGRCDRKPARHSSGSLLRSATAATREDAVYSAAVMPTSRTALYMVGFNRRSPR